jgi:uncharacterized radical SAM superfamily Fe-S cluster-containing enzyme
LLRTLTVDLTNGCNMTCSPCFTDTDPIGYVRELTLDEIKGILDDSISFEPRRQTTVQFSGGEPTMSPHFLEACRHAKDVGYFSVQASTDGLRFALEPEFAYQAKEAGFDLAYLPFDAVSHAPKGHGYISNPLDLEQRAIDVMHDAGIDVIPVTTVVDTVNDDRVGPMLDFVIQNSHRMAGVSFQPASFTGRDEETRDEGRRGRRYTISQLAYDLQRYTRGKVDPHRDWYPLGTMGAMGALSALADPARSLRGPHGPSMGALACSCHPSCGASFLVVANRSTGAWSTLTQFFDLERFMADVGVICDTARGRELTLAQAALSFGRNFDASKAPPGLSLVEFAKLFFNGMMGGGVRAKTLREQDWTVLWVGAHTRGGHQGAREPLSAARDW